MHRAPWMVAVIAAVALTAACSDDGPGPSDASSSPAGTAEASAAAPAGEAVAPAGKSYVDAVNAGDLDALVAAFAEDGAVVDVSRRITGRDAIRTWASNEVIGGRLQVVEVTPMTGGQDLLVNWVPEGSQGWRAHYRLTYAGDRIAVADLQYA